MTIDEHHKLDVWLLFVQLALRDYYPPPRQFSAILALIGWAAAVDVATLPDPPELMNTARNWVAVHMPLCVAESERAEAASRSSVLPDASGQRQDA